MAENFGIGSMGLGSLSSVIDTMDMVKRAWSSFGLPSNFTPTLDLDELDRRIADLKAVEQWLTMNLGMLQGTIKGLEVQRGTIAALQAFGQAMTTPAEASNFAAQAMTAMQRAAMDAGTATAHAPADPAPAGSAAGAPPDAYSPPAPPEAPPAGQASKAATRAVDSAGASLAEGMSRAAAAVNPTAWWNLLQGQFEQVAQAALAGNVPTGTGARPDEPAGEHAREGAAANAPKRKPRAGSSPKGKSARRRRGGAPAG